MADKDLHAAILSIEQESHRVGGCPSCGHFDTCYEFVAAIKHGFFELAKWCVEQNLAEWSDSTDGEQNGPCVAETALRYKQINLLKRLAEEGLIDEITQKSERIHDARFKSILHLTIEHNNLDLAYWLVNNDYGNWMEVDASLGRTLCMIALEVGAKSLARHLVQYCGNEWWALNKASNNTFLYAVYGNLPTLANELVMAGYGKWDSVWGEHNHNAMHVAVDGRGIAMGDFLDANTPLKWQVNLNSRNYLGRMYWWGMFEKVKPILEVVGFQISSRVLPNLNQPDTYGKVINQIIIQNHRAVFAFLIDKGVPIEKKGQASLIFALNWDASIDLVRLLLDQGAYTKEIKNDLVKIINGKK